MILSNAMFLTTAYQLASVLLLLSPSVHSRPSPYVHSYRDSTTNSSGKAGLAWPNGNYDNMTQYLTTGKVTWYYTWGPSSVNTDIEFVPMLWGQKDLSQFSSTINSTLGTGDVKAVLGMNEPEQSSQSNLSPSDGATMWKTYIEPLRSAYNVRLGSPAPSSAPAGLTWLQDFLTACDGGCTLDFIAVHYYDVNATNFQSFLTNYHNTFNKPIWVTEWACQNYNNEKDQCSQSEVNEFMNSTQSFMDETDWVERYAWFGAMENLQGVNSDNALMSSQGTITSLGEQYIGASSSGGGVTISAARITASTNLFEYALSVVIATLAVLYTL